MREILFRAKRVDNGEWVEGFYGQFHNRPKVQEENSHQIFEPSEYAYFCGSCVGGLWHIILPETLGQFTGLTDKNENKIFEGDIVQWGMDGEEFFVRKGIVEIAPDIQFKCINMKDHLKRNAVFHYGNFAYQDTRHYVEVIGNIYDNPELLEAE